MIYRAGLIGCGRIGAGINDSGASRIRSHAEACRKSVNIRLVAACDTDVGRLRRAAKRWEIPTLYSDFRTMLEKERLDLLSIASPTPTHGPILEAAASKPGPLGILLEKPVADSADNARALAKKLADSSLRVSLHYGRRFCPAYRDWVKAVRGGAIGKVRYAHGTYTGDLRHNGTHLLDLLRWFLGEPDGPLSWSQGTRARVDRFDPGDYNLFELDLIGTEGRLRFTDIGHRAEWFRVQPRRSLAFRQLQGRPRVEPTGLADSVQFALKNLIDAVEGKGQICCTLEDGVKALEWASRLEAGSPDGSLACR